MCTLSVSNVIYHKFSHGAAFYTLNGENVNVMLEVKVNGHTTVFCVFYFQGESFMTFWLLSWMTKSLKKWSSLKEKIEDQPTNVQ